jgi:excisionase family DNA binding protein
MDIKIKETGKVKDLSLIDPRTKIEWTRDLLGNANATHDGQFVWDDEAEVWLADQGTYDWWAKYIQDTEATQREVSVLADELDLVAADIELKIAKETGEDYETHRATAIRVLQELRDEYTATLTTQQAAEIIGVTRVRVIQFCQSGQLPATKPGRDWQIKRSDVEAFAARERPGGYPAGRPRKPTLSRNEN